MYIKGDSRKMRITNNSKINSLQKSVSNKSSCGGLRKVFQIKVVRGK